MRYGILGDIHANIQALDAVLGELARERVDHYISVGDIVGYGGDPTTCIDRVRSIKATVVAGNHDWAVVGKLDTSFFNVYAKAAVDWTASVLSADEKAWLANLPLSTELENHITVAHATVDAPEHFDYIQTYYDAVRSINAMKTPVAFTEHSHVPVAFLVKDSLSLSMEAHISLQGVHRALVNVGSIGQPRDENPMAAFALYDTQSREYELRRVRYDIKGACDRIRKVGLPAILAERLKFGR